MGVTDAGFGHWVSNKVDRAVDFLRFLWVQRVTGFTVSGTPEFEAACIPFFINLLTQASCYLEFGTGGSTVLAAMNGLSFVSVESDPVFLAAVKKRIADEGKLDESKQTYLSPDIGLTEAWGAPVLKRATPGRVKNWKRYMQAPWAAMADKPGPALVLVDGRFRVACALSAARHLSDKDVKILIDDYAERDHYRVVERHLEVKERCGRMVLFTPRADMDRAALDADIETYSADWR